MRHEKKKKWKRSPYQKTSQHSTAESSLKADGNEKQAFFCLTLCSLIPAEKENIKQGLSLVKKVGKTLSSRTATVEGPKK